VEAAVAAGVDDDVVATALGEWVVGAVVDDAAGAELAGEVELVVAGDAGDDAAEGVGDLDGVGADPRRRLPGRAPGRRVRRGRGPRRLAGRSIR
jgi:hypothetical protein